MRHLGQDLATGKTSFVSVYLVERASTTGVPVLDECCYCKFERVQQVLSNQM